MKRIGIIGTRRRDTAIDYQIIKSIFFNIYEDGDWIVSGGCKKGGDKFAKKLYEQNCIPYLEFPANWKRYGNGAGFVRNTYIAEWSQYLIAYVTNEGPGGTEDTVGKYKKMFPDYPLLLVYEDRIEAYNVEIDFDEKGVKNGD